MADTKLSDLSAASSVAGTDLLYTVQTAGVGGVKATVAQMSTAVVASTAMSNIKISSIGYVIDGGGAAITAGALGSLSIPYDCTINSVTLLADQSGSIVVDIWKDTLANYPPTVADTICASAKPTLSSATHSENTTLTGWTTSIAAGDTLKFNVDSATTVTQVTLILKVTKT